jgi:hypothetical protein
MYTEPTKNFEDVLSTLGFELYGKGGYNPNWVTKTEQGSYLTLTYDGVFTVLEWIPADGTNITDEDFIKYLVSDNDEDYETLCSMFITKRKHVLGLFYTGV